MSKKRASMWKAFVVWLVATLLVAVGCEGGGTTPITGDDGVTVSDQSTSDGKSILVDAVKISKKGFLVAAVEGSSPQNLGAVKLEPGSHSNIKVELKETITADARVAVALFHDNGDGLLNNTDVIVDGTKKVITVKAGDVAKPVLEIEDQSLADGQTVTVKRIYLPFLQTTVRLGIFADDGGKPGENLYIRSYSVDKTHTNQTVKLKTPLQGKHTLHAILFSSEGGWNTQEILKNTILKDPDGNEVKITFAIDTETSTNYLIASDQEHISAQKVVVEKAWSQDNYVWVVVHRDDNGKPGEILGKKRVIHRHSRKVTVDLERTGTLDEYFEGKGTRKYIKGEENVHIVLYKDEPRDNKFTHGDDSSQDQPLQDKDGKTITKVIKVTVKGSVDNKHKDSIYFYNQCEHEATKYYKAPTKLPVDCRCAKQLVGGFPICWRPSSSNNKKHYFGKGPGFSHLNFVQLWEGRMDPKTKEILISVWVKNNEKGYDTGLLVGFNTKTHTRRIISGTYYDNDKGFHTVGDGPELYKPQGIQIGPDGKVYMFHGSYNDITPMAITRIDPTSGKRELVWQINKPGTYGHCRSGRGTSETSHARSIQYRQRAFAMDPDGHFYLSFSNQGDTGEGSGIAKISKDGKSCSFVTRTLTGKDNTEYPTEPLGTGPRPQNGHYVGLHYHEGLFYGQIFVNGDVYQVDAKTGDRKIVYSLPNGGILGNLSVNWDPHRKGFWWGGLEGVFLFFEPSAKKMIYPRCSDVPASKDFTSFYKDIVCSHGTESVSGHSEGFILADPDDSDILYMALDTYGIVKYEVSTGNSYTISNK